jgi:hypothetical protein
MKVRTALPMIVLGLSALASSVHAQGETEAAFLRFLKETCAKDQADSCRQLAEAYETGKNGIAKDPAKAAESYKRAASLYQSQCDAKDADDSACTALARLYEGGRGVAVDAARAAAYDKKAFALYQRACDKGEAFECKGLGEAYQYGHGVPKDLAKAAALYKKACDGQFDPACELAKTIKAP